MVYTRRQAADTALNAAAESTSVQQGSSSASEERRTTRRTRGSKIATSASVSVSTTQRKCTSGMGDTAPEQDDENATGSSNGDEDKGTHGSKPPPKRRKKNGKWTAQMKLEAAAAREAKQSFLRSFIQLPQDIVLEMISHLPPKALLAIARTNKELRAMVLNRRHIDIWKTSRAEFGVPEPPAEFPEPRWASLLFNSACCQVCWKATNSWIDWYFLRRICSNCRNSHSIDLPYTQYFLLPNSHTERELLQLVDIEIMQYMIHEPTTIWFTSFRGPLFWKEDVVRVARKWQELAAHTDSAGRSAFHAWKVRQREAIRNHLNMIPAYQLWEIDTTYPSKKLKWHAKQRAERGSRFRRVEEIKARLREAGYIPEDIDMCTTIHSPYYPEGPLTGTAWAMMLPKIEDDVREHRGFRLALEMELVIHDRIQVLKEVYQGFLDTLPPSEQYFCPPFSYLRVHSSIVSILHTDRRIAVTPAYMRAKLGDMQAFIDRAQSERKQWIRDNTLPTTDNPWEFANYVFGREWHDGHPERASDRILVGWDMIATHSCGKNAKKWLLPGVPVDHPREIWLNVKASDHAQRLLGAAGFRRGTTVKMVDDRDPRFVCDTCAGACKVFTFRAALGHLHDNDSHKFRCADRREADAAKDNEGPARERAKAWSCNHCAQYLEASDADTKQAVLDHLADKHDVRDPELQRDYFVNERCRLVYEVSYVYESR